MTDNLFHKNPSLKDELIRIFMISFGTFLFILFFQPFPLQMLDFNDRLLYVTGFGIIVFVQAGLLLILFPLFFPGWFKSSEWDSGPPFHIYLFLFMLNVTSYAFYIRFVGKMPLNLYVLFKAVLICLLPIAALAILYRFKYLERIIGRLQEINKSHVKRLDEFEKETGKEKVVLSSENQANRVSLDIVQIIAIRSADNYVEVFHYNQDTVEKKMIRNTLKEISVRLFSRNDFIRCHRAAIINIKQVDKLQRNYSGYSLKMHGIEENIPVSRQFLSQVKEALAAES